jgi:hypothetical protein
MKHAILLIGLLLGLVTLHTNGEAQISLSVNSDLNLHLSHNQPCGTQSPRAAYVAVRATNTSGVTQNNLTITLAGLTNGFTLSGGQAGAQYIGSIPAGGHRDVFGS